MYQSINRKQCTLYLQFYCDMYSYKYKKWLMVNLLAQNSAVILNIKCDVIATGIATSFEVIIL
jgi:hypothetical protein